MPNPAYVGSAQASASTTDTLHLTYSATGGAGSILMIGSLVQAGPNSGILLIVDTGGNVWQAHSGDNSQVTPTITNPTPVGNYGFELWYSQTGNPTTSITITYGASLTTLNAIVGEYSNFSPNYFQDLHDGDAPSATELSYSHTNFAPVGFFMAICSSAYSGPDVGGTERRKIGPNPETAVLSMVDNMSGGAISETTSTPAVALSVFGFEAFLVGPSTGNIVIEKATVPAGSLQSFDFTTDYGSPFSLTDGQSNDSGPIAAGIYSVSEAAVANWTTTTSIDPSVIVVVAGETTTVTFTNTFTAGQILVSKVTSPPGATQPFTFTPDYGSIFVLQDGQVNLSANLAPGTYSVIESPVVGWTTTVTVTYGYGQGGYGEGGYGGASNNDSTQIVVGAGDVIAVVFTNTRVPVAIPCGKVLTRVDTWEMDNGQPDWSSDDSVPIAWYDSNLGQQKVGITRPSQNGTIGLLYIQLAATLQGAGTPMTIPDDWTPYVLWGALADLLFHDGPAYDPVRAKYCEQRYQEGVELARLVLKGA